MDTNPESESPEVTEATNQNKIYHFGEVDAVLPVRNFSRNNYEEMLQLATIAQTGDHFGMEPAGGIRSAEDRFFLLPETGEEPYRIFVKQKKSSGEDDPSAESFQRHRHMDKNEMGDLDLRILRVLNAHHSILNELSLSAEISSLTQSPEFRSIVRESGFDDIRLSEPLFATVNKKTRQQFIAYRNIEGAKKISEIESEYIEPDGDGQYRQQQTDLAASIRRSFALLKEYFLAQGYDPHDFQEAQLLYDRVNNILYISDIEGWFKKKTER